MKQDKNNLLLRTAAINTLSEGIWYKRIPIPLPVLFPILTKRPLLLDHLTGSIIVSPGLPLAVRVADRPVGLPAGRHRVHGDGEVDHVVPAEAEGLQVAPHRAHSHVLALLAPRALHKVRVCGSVSNGGNVQVN